MWGEQQARAGVPSWPWRDRSWPRSVLQLLPAGRLEGCPSLLPRPPAHPGCAAALPGRPPCLCSRCRGLRLWHWLNSNISPGSAARAPGVVCTAWQEAAGTSRLLGGQPQRRAPRPAPALLERVPTSWHPVDSPLLGMVSSRLLLGLPPLDWNPQQDALGAPLTCTHLARFGGFFVPGAPGS